MEGTNLNSFGKACDFSSNGCEQSETDIRLQELYSFGSDNVPKVPFFPITEQLCFIFLCDYATNAFCVFLCSQSRNFPLRFNR